MSKPARYRFTVELDLTEDVPREEDLRPGESLDGWAHEVVFRLLNDLKCHYLEQGMELLVKKKKLEPLLFDAYWRMNQKDTALAQQLQTEYTLTRNYMLTPEEREEQREQHEKQREEKREQEREEREQHEEGT